MGRNLVLGHISVKLNVLTHTHTHTHTHILILQCIIFEKKKKKMARVRQQWVNVVSLLFAHKYTGRAMVNLLHMLLYVALFFLITKLATISTPRTSFVPWSTAHVTKV